MPNSSILIYFKIIWESFQNPRVLKVSEGSADSKPFSSLEYSLYGIFQEFQDEFFQDYDFMVTGRND